MDFVLQVALSDHPSDSNPESAAARSQNATKVADALEQAAQTIREQGLDTPEKSLKGGGGKPIGQWRVADIYDLMRLVRTDPLHAFSVLFTTEDFPGGTLPEDFNPKYIQDHMAEIGNMWISDEYGPSEDEADED